MKRILSLLFPLYLLTACHENFWHDMGMLELTNNTDDTLCVYYATGFYCFGPTAYPDTLLPPGDLEQCHNGETFRDVFSKCLAKPHETGYLPDRFASFANDDGKLGFILPKDTLSVFFIDLDTLRKYGYDAVREQYLIRDRYDYPMDTIIKRHYKLTYP